MPETLQFQENKPLKELSTFGIGGPAKYFIVAKTVGDMSSIIKQCLIKNLSYVIIGKGSNSLFDDRGFNGVAIHNKIDFHENPSPGLYHVGAGYSFSLLGVQTARAGWSGLEFASGIPASIGGAVFMNAGANGRETAESLISVDYINEQGEFEVIPKEQLHFSYRTSSFQKMKGSIVGATFMLTSSPTARGKQIEIITYRKNTQPYGDKSCGCVFRNPANGHAGAIIDQSGLKGTRIGDAMVSSMHANFIVNVENATSEDVLSLIDLVSKKIKEKTGVHLESEVRYIPYEGSPP